MISKLFTDGVNKQITAGDNKEKTKIGTLRAGNTGMVNSKGQIIGSCAGHAYLRMLGINGKKTDLNKELMFAGGRLNEDHWVSVLKETWDGTILTEEQVPVSWETSNGVKVTGRPDIVLCSGSGLSIKPEVGIELKQVMSVNSAYNVLVSSEPQLKHLMQAAHYMWQLNVPYELWYTNRNNLDLPSWMDFREFPKPGTSDSIDYRYYRMGDVNPRTNKPTKHKLSSEEYNSLKGQKGVFFQASKITPFVKGFQLDIDDKNTVWYRDASNEKAGWIKSIVNIDDIVRFYEYVAELPEHGKVPTPAVNLTATGEQMNWKFGDYSELEHLDPEYKKGTDLKKWVDDVKRFLDNNK